MRWLWLGLAWTVLALAGCGTVQRTLHSRGAPGTGKSNPAAARADARHLLSLLVLPSGAVRSNGAPPAALRHPGDGLPVTPDVVDLHTWWLVKESMSGLLAFVQRHPPQGSKLTGSGRSARGSTTVSRELDFSWPALRGELSYRTLVVEIAPLPHGNVGVRADAQDVWIQPRPAGERVPPGARVLTVARGWPRHKPSVSFTTTNGGKIEQIAALLDQLQIDQPGVVNCPAMRSAPTVTFTFRAARASPPLAQASMPATGPDGDCPGIAFKVQDRPEPPLYALPSFLGQAGRILGQKLATK